MTECLDVVTLRTLLGEGGKRNFDGFVGIELRVVWSSELKAFATWRGSGGGCFSDCGQKEETVIVLFYPISGKSVLFGRLPGFNCLLS